MVVKPPKPPKPPKEKKTVRTTKRPRIDVPLQCIVEEDVSGDLLSVLDTVLPTTPSPPTSTTTTTTTVAAILPSTTPSVPTTLLPVAIPTPTPTPTTTLLTTNAPANGLMLCPFDPARLTHEPDELCSESMDSASGVETRRSRINTHNTSLFVRDHVMKALQMAIPHTSISSLQLIRPSQTASPFGVLQHSIVRFKVTESMTSTKLMAFLARPDFDVRFINIRYPLSMFRFFGITAFSNSVVDEITRSLHAAVDIDLCVPELIAAWMSHLGYPMKMSASGTEISGQNHTQRSLAGSSYNTVIQAAQTGERAIFNSVPSAVAVGNRVPLGTNVELIRRKNNHKTISQRMQQEKERRENDERIAAFQRMLAR